MNWMEYYETDDYLRQADESLSLRLGGGPRKAQLNELKTIIGRVEKVIQSRTDNNGREYLEALRQRSRVCYNKIMHRLNMLSVNINSMHGAA